MLVLIISIILILLVVLDVKYWKYKENEESKKDLERTKARIKEEKRRMEIINKELDLFFSNLEMNNKLEAFIINHTKKYDYNEIEYREYSNSLDMLSKYINNKIKKKELQGNREENTILLKDDTDILILKGYIDAKKNKIYYNEMKGILDSNNYGSQGNIIIRYLNTYGKKGLKELNIEVLSQILDKNYEKTYNMVKEKYNKIKTEYEIDRLEKNLFSSELNNRDLEYIDNLSGFEFEDYLEELFTDFGYEIEDLPYSNDYGADLIVRNGFKEIVIQAKNYTSNVGNKAVQEVIAAKSHYKSDIAMVITNSYYTQNAIKTAEASDIILVDRDGLERMLNEGNMYFSSLIS